MLFLSDQDSHAFGQQPVRKLGGRFQLFQRVNFAKRFFVIGMQPIALGDREPGLPDQLAVVGRFADGFEGFLRFRGERDLIGRAGRL
ncbi:MAG: hypothetical protein HY290_18030 [Planctomycetia bacterium]|nr:hypothetical protein [Planctomycetia bacterium]